MVDLEELLAVFSIHVARAIPKGYALSLVMVFKSVERADPRLVFLVQLRKCCWSSSSRVQHGQSLRMGSFVFDCLVKMLMPSG